MEPSEQVQKLIDEQKKALLEAGNDKVKKNIEIIIETIAELERKES